MTAEPKHSRLVEIVYISPLRWALLSIPTSLLVGFVLAMIHASAARHGSDESTWFFVIIATLGWTVLFILASFVQAAWFNLSILLMRRGPIVETRPVEVPNPVGYRNFVMKMPDGPLDTTLSEPIFETVADFDAELPESPSETPPSTP